MGEAASSARPPLARAPRSPGNSRAVIRYLSAAPRTDALSIRSPSDRFRLVLRAQVGRLSSDRLHRGRPSRTEPPWLEHDRNAPGATRATARPSARWGTRCLVKERAVLPARLPPHPGDPNRRKVNGRTRRPLAEKRSPPSPSTSPVVTCRNVRLSHQTLLWAILQP